VRPGNGFGGGPRAVAAQLARAVEIATILSASGFDWLVQALGLSAWVSPRRLVCAFRTGTRCPPHLEADVPLPERLRLTLERFGPTFIKAGQMLALRPDYVPLEYAEALRGLHAHVGPSPAAEAVAIVEVSSVRRPASSTPNLTGSPLPQRRWRRCTGRSSAMAAKWR
jgi:ubiquinone biosynthesis protein